jgi:hypothetical protein
MTNRIIVIDTHSKRIMHWRWAKPAVFLSTRSCEKSSGRRGEAIGYFALNLRLASHDRARKSAASAGSSSTLSL